METSSKNIKCNTLVIIPDLEIRQECAIHDHKDKRKKRSFESNVSPTNFHESDESDFHSVNGEQSENEQDIDTVSVDSLSVEPREWPVPRKIDESNPEIVRLRNESVELRNKNEQLIFQLESLKSQIAQLIEANNKKDRTIKSLKAQIRLQDADIQALRTGKISSHQRKENPGSVQLNLTTSKLGDDSNNRILEILSSNSYMQRFQEGFECLAECMKSKPMLKGWQIFTKGNPCSTLYIIESGSCSFTREKNATFVTDNKPPAKAGDILGDVEIFYKSLHVRTCVCTVPGKVWYISRDEFQKAVKNTMRPERLREIRRFLTSLPSFFKFSKEKIRDLVLKSEVILLAPGDLLGGEGYTIRHIYIIKRGSLQAVVGQTGEKVLGSGELIAPTSGTNKLSRSYVAYGAETTQCVSISLSEFTSSELKFMTSTKFDATKRNVRAFADAHLREYENPDDDKSGSSGYVSQSSASSRN